MRTDVKLGIVISMGVVLAAGGYFLFRGKGEAPVPVTDKLAAADPVAAKAPLGKPATSTPGKPRQTVTSKDPNVGRNPPVGPSTPGSRPAATPVNPSVANPQPTTTALRPSTEPVRTEPQPAATVPNTPAQSNPDSLAAGNPTAPMGVPAVTPTDSSLTNPVAPPSSGSELPGTNNPSVTGTSLTSATPSGMGAGLPVLPASSPLAPNKPDLRFGATESHRVQAGDSLETLAQTYYGNRKYAKFLADSNPQIVDPAKPTVGAFVKIPPLPADIEAKPASSTRSPAEKAAAPVSADASGKRTYKVKSGDSFYRIAREQLGNATRWKELLALNKTVVKGDPTQLQVGQTLVLPES